MYNINPWLGLRSPFGLATCAVPSKMKLSFKVPLTYYSTEQTLILLWLGTRRPGSEKQTCLSTSLL